MKSCPKCSHEQEDAAAACLHCGLVFAKWEASQSRLSAATSESANAAAPTAVSARADSDYAREWVHGTGLFASIAMGFAVFVLFDLLGVSSKMGGLTFVVAFLIPVAARFVIWAIDGSPTQLPSAWIRKFGLEEAVLRSLRNRIVVGFLCGWVVVGILLVIGTRRGFGLAATTGAYAVCFLIFGIWRLAKARFQGRNGRPAVALILSAGLLIAIATNGQRSIVHAHERNFAPLISALSSYKTETGAYPERLDQLTPAYLSEIPACPMQEGSLGKLSYSRLGANERGEEGYELRCVIGVVFPFPQYAEYDPRCGFWQYHD